MSTNMEARLLSAIAASTDLDEQARLMGRLEEHRASVRADRAAERELDLGAQITEAAFTPVRTFERHTHETDWLASTAAGTADERTALRTARAEALMWKRSVIDAVRADREEYAEQARGKARQVASSFGPHREAAIEAFLTAAEVEEEPRRKQASGEIGERRTLTLPWSEVNMHMQLAGETVDGELVGPRAVQLYEQGTDNPISFPITTSEAGWGMVGTDHTLTDFDEDGYAHPKASARRTADVDSAVVDLDSNKVYTRACALGEAGYSCDGFTASGAECECSCHFAWDGEQSLADFHSENEEDLHIEARLRTAAEGDTCAVCGDKIARDDAQEDPATWHHDNGEKHDHEAKPADSSKESSRRTAGRWKVKVETEDGSTKTVYVDLPEDAAITEVDDEAWDKVDGAAQSLSHEYVESKESRRKRAMADAAISIVHITDEDVAANGNMYPLPCLVYERDSWKIIHSASGSEWLGRGTEEQAIAEVMKRVKHNREQGYVPNEPYTLHVLSPGTTASKEQSMDRDARLRHLLAADVETRDAPSDDLTPGSMPSDNPRNSPSGEGEQSGHAQSGNGTSPHVDPLNDNRGNRPAFPEQFDDGEEKTVNEVTSRRRYLTGGPDHPTPARGAGRTRADRILTGMFGEASRKQAMPSRSGYVQRLRDDLGDQFSFTAEVVESYGGELIAIDRPGGMYEGVCTLNVSDDTYSVESEGGDEVARTSDWGEVIAAIARLLSAAGLAKEGRRRATQRRTADNPEAWKPHKFYVVDAESYATQAGPFDSGEQAAGYAGANDIVIYHFEAGYTQDKSREHPLQSGGSRRTAIDDDLKWLLGDDANIEEELDLMQGGPGSTSVEVPGPPRTCDICSSAEAKYDGKTKMGPWANMCRRCFIAHGMGLGTGRGQELVYTSTRRRPQAQRRQAGEWSESGRFTPTPGATTTFEKWEGWYARGNGNYSRAPKRDVPIIEPTPPGGCRFCGAGPEHMVNDDGPWHRGSACTRCGAATGYGMGD